MTNQASNQPNHDVAGLVLHPERACESLPASNDGKCVFESIFGTLKKAVAIA